MPIEKDKVGLILLGAQRFPNAEYKGSEAFYSAYSKIKNFFKDSGGISVSDELILDLFDSSDGPDGHDQKIVDFIKEKKARGITDLIIYYTGHGDYTTTNAFILIINQTRSSSLEASSIPFRNLSAAISRHAAKLRTFIILDCCFAGAAGMEYMSAVHTILKKEVETSLPSEGVAVLAATSKDSPALLINDRNITMFTEGFDKALRTGSAIISNNFLSFRQLKEITFDNIKELNPGNAVSPEVHTPKQHAGDIADLPHFPNRAVTNKLEGLNLNKRLKEIMILIINDDMPQASQMLLTLSMDLNIDYQIIDKIVDQKTNSESLVERRGIISKDFDEKRITREERDQMLRELWAIRGEITKEFFRILGDVKKSIK